MDVTEKPTEVKIRPMSLSDILSNTFSIYGQAFLKFAVIIVLGRSVSWILTYLLDTTFWGALLNDVVSERIADLETEAIIPAGMTFVFFIVWVVSIVLSIWMNSSMVHMTSTVHFRERPALRASMKRGFSRLLRILVIYLFLVILLGVPAALVVIMFGALSDVATHIDITLFILLAPVVIYFCVRFAFISQMVFIENSGIIEAVIQSWQLVKGYWWRTFGFALVFLLVAMGISLVLDFIPLVGQILAAIIATPIQIIGMTLIYWDLRARQEKVTLDTIKEELNTSAG